MQKNKDNLNIHKCCNVCGRELSILPSGEQEETLTVEKSWGYFSNKDGISQKVNICEECYDHMVEDEKTIMRKKEENILNKLKINTVKLWQKSNKHKTVVTIINQILKKMKKLPMIF